MSVEFDGGSHLACHWNRHAGAVADDVDATHGVSDNRIGSFAPDFCP